MTSDWRPTATREALELRAHLLTVTRTFFAERGVLEVETPLLAQAPVPDLHLDSFAVPTSQGERWLQTSPEYAMKRLLAAGSGPIYQISKVFREGEAGRRHNPEFTLLEWYRPGIDADGLMDEMDAYLVATLDAEPAERRSYEEIFRDALGLDPHRASVAELADCAAGAGLGAPSDLTRDDWLQWLLAQRIEPELGGGADRTADGTDGDTADPRIRPTFVVDFPASQAALARIREDPGRPPVAERFEVFIRGMELANGFHELTDAAEQRRRFEGELEKRRAAGKPTVPLDERFLAALEDGLPDCSGVALGFDRLVMVASGTDRLDDVMAFPFGRA